MQNLFYIDNPYPAEDDKAKWLHFRRLPVTVVSKPNVEVNGVLEAQLILLHNVARQLSTRDLCEEFCILWISPLARDWGISIEEFAKGAMSISASLPRDNNKWQ